MSAAPPSSPLVRRLVVRGDAIAASLMLCFAGGLTFGGLVLGAVSMGPGLLGAVAIGAGLLGLRWSRQAYRALLAEVVTRFAGHDPGPSPVPWVGDAVWRAKNRFDPFLDAPNELLAEVDPMFPGFGKDGGRGVLQPVLRPVGEDERMLVAAPPAPEVEVVTPSGEAGHLLERLAATPGRTLVVSPRWPVCCRQLTVLVGLNDVARPEEAIYLGEQLPIDGAGRPGGQGQHSYRCGRCGRAYATDPAW
jgi:hypothetical protein